MDTVQIELLNRRHAHQLWKFEQENRSFFEATLPTRGDAYYEWDTFVQTLKGLEDEQRAGTCYMYIIRSEHGDIVGRVNLFSIVGEPVWGGELGFRMGERHQRRGYATAAVRLVVEKAFAVHGLHRLEAGTSPANVGAQVVLIKNGFQYVGRAHEVLRINNVWQNSLLFEKINRA